MKETNLNEKKNENVADSGALAANSFFDNVEEFVPSETENIEPLINNDDLGLPDDFVPTPDSILIPDASEPASNIIKESTIQSGDNSNFQTISNIEKASNSGSTFAMNRDEINDPKFYEGINLDDLEKKIDKLERNLINSPFEEEFSPENVINRGAPSDFIVEDLLKIQYEAKQEALKNRTDSYFIPKSELDLLISENPVLKLYKKNEKGEIVQLDNGEAISMQGSRVFVDDLVGLPEDELIEISVPVGKKNVNQSQIGSHKHQPPNDANNNQYGRENNNSANISYDGYDDYDDENYYLSDEEAEELEKKKRMQETLQSIQNVIENLTIQTDRSSDEILREYLQANFQDYFLAQSISGNNEVRYSDKIIPSGMIDSRIEQLEIADLLHTNNSAVQKTSVLINRNEEMDIESIEVLCKCGEKTVIRFDEVDEADIKGIDDSLLSIENTSDTDIVVDLISVKPLDYGKEEAKYEEKSEEVFSDEEIAALEEYNEDDE